MVITKEKNSFIKALIFVYLILFPFGQILRRELSFGNWFLVFQPIDLVAGIALLIFLFGRRKSIVGILFSPFFAVLVFSLFFSLSFFNFHEIIPGIFYFLRLIAYFSLFSLTYDLVQKDKKFKDVLFNSLILIVVTVSLFGWFQYFFYPDLRALYYLGWDDHLFRLIGTFLDPGFTSIIVVFGFLASLSRYIERKEKVYVLLSVFFLITLGFTYSRAGFLALVFGLAVLLREVGRKKLFLGLITFFVLIIFLLPRPSSEGVKLERTSSVLGRMRDYKETLLIWQKSPVFGIGYNNICQAKQKFLSKRNLGSHSCNGADSSLLFLLSTTRVVGVIALLFSLITLISQVERFYYGNTLKSSLAALLVHSQFVNSLFYPWVMGWIFLLLAISLKGVISRSEQ